MSTTVDAAAAAADDDEDDDDDHAEKRSSRFFTIFSLRRELSPTRTLKQHNGRSSCATCRVPSGTTGQLSC